MLGGSQRVSDFLEGSEGLGFFGGSQRDLGCFGGSRRVSDLLEGIGLLDVPGK